MITRRPNHSVLRTAVDTAVPGLSQSPLSQTQAFAKSVTMKLGSAYFRHSLIKLGILSVAMPFILWDFFTSKDTESDPGSGGLHF